MSSRSSSPSVSSDDDSESNFSFTEDRSDDIGEGCFYDDSLEPVATEEEVAAYEESSAREEEQLEEYRRRRTGETSVSTWCKCSLCSVEAITKPEECICCKEIDRVSEVMGQLDLEDRCIILHPGFQDVCLNRWVLEVASLNLKTKAGKSYRVLRGQGGRNEADFLRSVSYRQFTRLLWDYLGSSKRYPLPCCAYNAIRKAFPSDDGRYRGFEEEEEEEGERDEDEH
ncbi:PREDICTED: uncharacterized protein LOC107338057 isoform X1 [Acropora digitifera]|uniref:uncharacterized protein LOC107338057 isoform X1 n=1 Tax=Acropora digitifera TaxID=70779 RepID=UPI00077AB94A|nr:PREDICTED: uncharacterized protein LOC107338057 isoform X1 [Acropora digitifera]